MEATPHKLVTILNARFIHEVQIAQSKLELEGIQSFIIDEHITYSIGTAHEQGFKLRVDSSDIVKAKITLEVTSE